MEIEQIKQKAVAQIEAAFADTPPPKAETYVIVNYACEFLTRNFTGKHWGEITGDLLFKQRECLSYLTPEAFRFYIPSYMLAVLLHPDKVDTLMDRIVTDLAPSSGQIWSNDHNAHLLKQADRMSKRELEAILAFLDVYQKYSVAKIAPFYDLWLPPFMEERSRKLDCELEEAIKFWSSIRDRAEF
ncbi:MAG: DUF6714 family protein [Chloroflexota bacterium]